MKNKILILLLFCGITQFGNAQQPPAASFGGFFNSTPDIKDEISPEQRLQIQQTIKNNLAELSKKGLLPNKTEAIPKFILPIRQAAGFNFHGYYGISNYIDLDDSTANIKDFNCGNRTYDGHLGTDFFTAPYPWHKMDSNAVEIVAAADGIIVAKQGSLPDTSCANCPIGAPASCWYWNAVYLQHADGTLSMYGHMKTNSLTTKEIGESVVAGEYIGVVGSSGNSSGPHLHFEVWTDTFFVKNIDPWKGSCNLTTEESYWQTQEAYYVPGIMDVTSGSNIPLPYTCYENGNGEKTFKKDTFNLGETVYLTSFVRDNIPNGSPYHLKLTDPDNIVIYDWPLSTFSTFYPSAYFYYIFTSSTINKIGEWKFYLEYGGDEYTKNFYVQDVMPLTLIDFSAQPYNNQVLLQWKTTDEINTDYFFIERGAGNLDYKPIASISAKGISKSGTINNYAFYDENPSAAELYYRLKMVDKDGAFTYSPVQKATLNAATKSISLYPNPAKNKITLQGIEKYKKVRITDLQGKILFNQSLTGEKVELDISRLNSGMYILQLGNENFEINLKLIKN